MCRGTKYSFHVFSIQIEPLRLNDKSGSLVYNKVLYKSVPKTRLTGMWFVWIL